MSDARVSGRGYRPISVHIIIESTSCHENCWWYSLYQSLQMMHPILECRRPPVRALSTDAIALRRK